MFHGAGGADPNAFRTIFFEEAQDHLANIEAVLLALDREAPQPDDLNAIFRAVHSIKGSAAMLGCSEIAALSHLWENLLDLLRKGERPLELEDIEAMLQAGDIVRLQVLWRRGLLDQPPAAEAIEALLRERVARPAADGQGPAGEQLRRFRVRLGPLEQPVPPQELELMLTGLAEMGQVEVTELDNRAGGGIAFEVMLQGSALDLQGVLALLVAPELVAIEPIDAHATMPPAAAPLAAPRELPAAASDAAPPAAVVTLAGAGPDDEFFVDPAQFRRRAGKPDLPPAPPPPPVEEADDGIELFVSPQQWRAQRRAAAPEPAVEPAPSQPAIEAAAPAPVATQGPEPAPAQPPAKAAAPAQPAAAIDPLDLHLPAPESTFIRVATEKIDLLVNLVGELVITEAMLQRQGLLAEQQAQGRYSGHSGLADLARHTRNLQEAVLAIRMLPISNVFARFPRVVHELSGRLGKKVELKLSGESTELDRGLIEKISDPLMHLVRNAIDHGLEPPAERLAQGKPAVGTVQLRASQRGGNIVIEVSDDGRGLDRARILQRARERGLQVAPEAPDAEVWQLIFEAGFSTAEQVTDVSGRGVGMDVVRRNIQALGGTIELDSRPGQGMKVTVSVPLTLAIMDAMTVAVGSEVYVLPLACVVESRSIEPGELHRLPGQGETLRVREDYLPALHLARLFPPREPARQANPIAVIVETDGAKAALVVDELVGQQQVVVKSLEANFRKVPGLSGATVMGDGSVALILDVGYLLRQSGREEALRLSAALPA